MMKRYTTITEDALKELINELDLKWAKFKDTNGNQVFFANEENSERLWEKISWFLSLMQPGEGYVVQVKPLVTDGHNMYTYFIAYPGVNQKMQMNGVVAQSGESPAEIEKRIRQAIMSDLEAKKIKEEREEFESEKKALETYSGKFQYILEIALAGLIENFKNGKLTPKPQMQGMAFFNQKTDIKPPGTPEELEEWKEDLNIAFEIFKKMLHPQYICEIAQQLDDNPKLARTIVEKLT